LIRARKKRQQGAFVAREERAYRPQPPGLKRT